MEFLPGGDLYSLLQKLGSIDEKSTKYYILQILNALQYLHSNSIIHRDLKPDNILVSADGRLKLSDFGLSYIGIVNQQANENPSIPKAKSIVGTPDYIAPEIILNETHDVTADYWSLGVILYEFLVGTPPFHGSSEQETFDNIVSCRYTIDEEFDLSKKAIDLIQRLLTVNPSERLGSRDISDIINHPFFNGVTVDDDPPFKPDLANEEDTDYFDTRYSFSEKEESSIIADITGHSTPEASSKSNGNCDNSAGNGSKIISSFESVSVKSLAEETRMAIKRKRSRSFVVYNDNNHSDSSGINFGNNDIRSSEFDFLSADSLGSSSIYGSCSCCDQNQLSILQPSPLQSPPRTPQFNKSFPPSFMVPPLDPPAKPGQESNVKPLINTSHAETLVIPFQKPPMKSYSRRKRSGGTAVSTSSGGSFGGFSVRGSSQSNDNKRKMGK